MPGSTLCRRRCRSEYSSKYSARRGRGPTKLISPRRTFQISGSSSRLLTRSHRPSRVSRDRSLPAPSRMVRNFNSSNVLPLCPPRSCRKSTGCPTVKRIAAVIVSSNGEQTNRPKVASVRSSARFIPSAYRRETLFSSWPRALQCGLSDVHTATTRLPSSKLTILCPSRHSVSLAD